MKNENKFLVTWIDDDGAIFGQAARDEDNAARMFDHLVNCGHKYVEVRRIGPIAKIGRKFCQYERTVQ
ncbi:MAG: hypothetical protein KGJ13_05345 [Patescibacteria group bacterium]|nr:hypothetical protein [Patescibacteria group bacterium]